ncbi:MAG TPA: hypothetical protein V6C78_13605 [Crinalium sp.]
MSIHNQTQQHVISCSCHRNQHDQPVSFGLAVYRLWEKWLVDFRRSNTPKIWHTSDRLGNRWWHAYNPATGCSATRESELEILEWIDQGGRGE